MDDATDRLARATVSEPPRWGLFDGSMEGPDGTPCDFKSDTRTLAMAEKARPREGLLYDTANIVGARVRLSNLWRTDNDSCLSDRLATVVGTPVPYVVPGLTQSLDAIYVKMLCPVVLEASEEDLAALDASLIDQQTGTLPFYGFSSGWPAGGGPVSVCSKNLEFVCAACGQPGKLRPCNRCEFAKYCGRECQVAHYASHKKACKAAARRRDATEPQLRFPIGSWVLSQLDFERTRAAAAGCDITGCGPTCKHCRDRALTVGSRGGTWVPALVVAHHVEGAQGSVACYQLCFTPKVECPGFPRIPPLEGRQETIEARVPEDTDRYVRAIPHANLREFYRARIRQLDHGSNWRNHEWDYTTLAGDETESPTVVMLVSLLCYYAHDRELVEFSAIARGMVGTNIGRAAATFVRGEGSTLLIMAAKYLRPTHVDLVLAMGARPVIDAQTKEGNCALALAARRPVLAVVKRLLAEGANPHLTADFGGFKVRSRVVMRKLTALACGVQGGFRDVVEALLEHCDARPLAPDDRRAEERALLFVAYDVEMERGSGGRVARSRPGERLSRDMRHLNKVDHASAMDLLFEIKARDGWFAHSRYDSIFLRGSRKINTTECVRALVA